MNNEYNDTSSVAEGENYETQENTEVYPSAKFLVDACFQDYLRLQENYNKLYEKLNVALAFAGVVLTLVLGTFDFEPAIIGIEELQIWEIILLIVHTLCIVSSAGLLFYGTIRFLTLLTGRRLPVFKSEDVRNNNIYKEEEQYAALWLIDKYTICTNELRPIVAEKQKVFERALKAIIIGLIMYTVALVLGKAGY